MGASFRRKRYHVGLFNTHLGRCTTQDGTTAMLLLLATLIGPILFFLLTWVVATVYRLYFPEEPLPYERDPVVLREKATASGQSVPVGVREIRADQRRSRRRQQAQPSYSYAWGGSEGFPEAWHEDLWLRRN